MNKIEIAEKLRQEVGVLEQSILKVQAQCDRLKKFVLALEAELSSGQPEQGPGVLESPAFRKAIDRVFGEKPRRRRPS